MLCCTALAGLVQVRLTLRRRCMHRLVTGSLTCFRTCTWPSIGPHGKGRPWLHARQADIELLHMGILDEAGGCCEQHAAITSPG